MRLRWKGSVARRLAETGVKADERLGVR